MKNKLMAAMAATVLCVPITAMAGVISGKVVDSSTDEPMEYVNVTLSNATTGKELPVGTMSGGDGSFMLSDIPTGSYKVKLSFVGYNAAFVDAVLRSSNESLDLNVVELSENTHILDEVEVVGVDEDGEVSLRGNSSVTIWINGRPSGLTADNRGQILEQLPAETIEKIEVITNPSAKYSPEGTSGIINIVLKRNRQAGYFGGAQAGAWVATSM